jgi:hypothetical protein
MVLSFKFSLCEKILRQSSADKIRSTVHCTEIHSPQDGRTPLHFAADHGHMEVLAALIAGKADIEAKTTVRGARYTGHPFYSS